MKERQLESRCMQTLEQLLGRPLILWKIADCNTGGQPDLEIACRGATTKIEFKLTKKGECIHDKWEDPRQLVTLYNYERTTGRAWAVFFRAANEAYDRPINDTLIYRPSKLLDKKIPTHGDRSLTSISEVDLTTLWHDGVIRLAGFNYAAIADLIKLTHK